MTFEIDINGRTRTVTVDRPSTGHFRVTLDGETRQLDVVRCGVHGLSMILGEERVSRELQVTPTGSPGEVLVTVSGRIMAATINARQTGRGGDGGTAAAGEVAVTAPMPGRVLRVLVQAGDDVAARQSVVVVEAMKMENELRAPKAGRVKDVHVTAGTSVEAGRVLMVIE